MYTPGTLLRLAREERKLSISDVKQFAKIRESAIMAMETDEFERFPAAYMQTFLPSYADFLGVPQYKLAEAFKATLPEYGYLARSLYSRTLQQIAFAQMQMELVRQNPPLLTRAATAARKHSARLVVVLIAFVLGWSVMTSDISLIGTLFANRFVSTPEDMRGTPFTEITDSIPYGTNNETSASGAEALKINEHPNGAEEQTQQMQTIHLASLLNVHVDMDALKAVAFKQTEAATRSVGTALVSAVDEIAPPEPMSAPLDASRRSISSIASSMLAREPRVSDAPAPVQLPSSRITEAAIEQHSEHGAPSGQVLVAGVENEPLSASVSSSLKRKRAIARVLALTASFGANKGAHTIENVETVALKMLPIEQVQLIIPAMHPSQEYQLRQAAMKKIPLPTIIIPAASADNQGQE
jgi:cytoskeletal protein RodZ